jgi:hypothetical protein
MNASLPRKRRALWAAHNVASQRMIAALHDFHRDNTGGLRARTSAPVGAYVQCLPPLIGHEAAFRYEAAWRAFEHATTYAEQYKAAMAASGALDEANAALSEALERELENAARAFASEQVALKTALEAAWERDEQDGT